ncbi:GNAT family N-acetyltransferase [Xylanimonas sp. McL0601]|uniref:GNAT family N-acetyltransferase n=1 Tax=Xylanimonas sp. McL0601 TaxID=3414739 RepID=UPI003CEE4E9B
MTSPAPARDDSALDNPVWSSLTGAHAGLAVGGDLVRRFPDDVSPFAAVRTWDEPGVWDAILALVGPGGEFPLPPAGVALPHGWETVFTLDAWQLVETDRLETRPDDEAVVLGADDAPEMLALVERSRPGPFLPRTYVMGRYVGIRRDGRLVAMAGERVRPAGWTEISAVTTDPGHRGEGLASRLVRDVAHHVHARGDRAYLHTSADNPALSLYERLGFEIRRPMVFGTVRTPGA